MDLVKIRNMLHLINWDFEDAQSQYGLHRFHWYPATFIPQIPSYLIELFSQQGDTVYDPFCGVGTTLVEALRLGRKAIGVDVNYLACMVARAKISFFDPQTLKEKQRSIEDILYQIGPLYAYQSSSLMSSEEYGNLVEEYNFIKPWYHDETFQQLILIWHLIGREQGRFQALLYVAFSQILKKCSSQTEHWGYVADNMIPKNKIKKDAIKLFKETLDENIDALTRFLQFPIFQDVEINELNTRACVLQGNLLHKSPLKKYTVDLIVTSPPYVNVTDYTTSQRLSFYWFKKDLNILKRDEVGARWKRFRKNAIEQYLHEMDLCFGHLTYPLKQGKFLCFVLGESRNREQNNRVVQKLCETIERKGFCCFSNDITRTPSRQRLRDRYGSLNKERILIFQKC